MPPIAAQILSPQLDAFRAQLAEIANAATSDEAYQRMISLSSGLRLTHSRGFAAW